SRAEIFIVFQDDTPYGPNLSLVAQKLEQGRSARLLFQRKTNMLKLRRIEIIGFKSFSDRGEITVNDAGVTAIVGPNGCGKSNVSDAIAWVLGEQSAKSLRGEKMEDVIFNGTRNRPPMGMAEVVLHMVRDEVVESEPDIEDIDSTLEQIDEQ